MHPPRFHFCSPCPGPGLACLTYTRVIKSICSTSPFFFWIISHTATRCCHLRLYSWWFYSSSPKRSKAICCLQSDKLWGLVFRPPGWPTSLCSRRSSGSPWLFALCAFTQALQAAWNAFTFKNLLTILFSVLQGSKRVVDKLGTGYERWGWLYFRCIKESLKKNSSRWCIHTA